MLSTRLDNQQVLENRRLRDTPCPRCGYDLRAHADRTRCPECGSFVEVSASIGKAGRWVDGRLLDLWSIGVLQMAGSVMMLVSIAAIHGGQYFAVLLALMSGLCVSVASMWFLVLAPGTVVQLRRPHMRALERHSITRLWRWFLLDGALIALLPVVLMLLIRI